MDSAETQMLTLETVETPKASVAQSDKTWTRGSIREESDRKRPRTVVGMLKGQK